MLFDRGMSSEIVIDPFGYSSTLSVVEATSSATDEIILAFEACLDFCFMFVYATLLSINNFLLQRRFRINKAKTSVLFASRQKHERSAIAKWF